jgi:hypothetical protein
MRTVIGELTLEKRETHVPLDDPAEKLRQAFRWPSERPEIKGPIPAPGWFGEGTDQVLAGVLTPQTRLVVELGAWLGMSTRYIADNAPNATVVSIDHWQGNPEHQTRDDLRAMLPTLYDTFLALCWRYRDQVIPMRMTTLEGLRTVAQFGASADVVFIDAEHSYAAVSAELALARQLFPKAQLVGDDFDWQPVQSAAEAFARANGLNVERVGARGWKLAERGQVSANGAPYNGRGRSSQVVLVPHLNGIEPACEKGLQEVEMAGVHVCRRVGSSQIDLARSEMLSDALHDGFESMLFIDADIGFSGADALRLFDRPEPVVAGIYAKKGPREVSSIFADGVKQVVFGPDAPSSYPLKYAATGFLRIRAEVLRLMIERLKMPLVNTRWGRGLWPFFHSILVQTGENEYHYLGEDWSFSHRLALAGITAIADTSFRLHHFGPYGYSWEDVGSDRPRYRTYNLQLG